MEFKRKLKVRFITSIIFGCIGLTLMITGFLRADEYLSSFGLIFLVIGIARVGQYMKITRNEETLRKRQVAETDERNIMLWQKARSATFTVYILLAATGIVVLNILKMQPYADVLSYSLFGFVAIYWICYFVISRKN